MRTSCRSAVSLAKTVWLPAARRTPRDSARRLSIGGYVTLDLRLNPLQPREKPMLKIVGE